MKLQIVSFSVSHPLLPVLYIKIFSTLLPKTSMQCLWNNWIHSETVHIWRFKAAVLKDANPCTTQLSVHFAIKSMCMTRPPETSLVLSQWTYTRDCIWHDIGPAVKMNILHSPSTRPLLRVLRVLLLVDLLFFCPPSVITCTSDSSEDDLSDDSVDSVSSASPSSMKSRSEPSESDSIKRWNTMTQNHKTVVGGELL